MKTVTFHLINPQPGMQAWTVEYITVDPLTGQALPGQNWHTTSNKLINQPIVAQMANDTNAVFFAAGLNNSGNPEYQLVYPQPVDFLNGQSYTIDIAGGVLTLMGTGGGTPPPAPTGGGFMEFMSKNAVPLGVGALVLVGFVMFRRK